MSGNDLIIKEDIKNKIFTIRNAQVMLDSDLAKLYNVDVKRLNEQVKRNKSRFPEEFCFQLTDSELSILKSQIATSSWGGRRTKPYAFTEQGVAMLSAVLRSDTAVKMSIQIINAFIAMRRFILSNAEVFHRLDSLEIKQIETDKKLEQVFAVIESRDIQPRQGIFFNGQIFDAYKFIAGLIRKAEKKIVLIDNYIDETVLDLFTKKKKHVQVTILTRNVDKTLKLDMDKFNKQYPLMTIKEFSDAHDRFLILDDKDVYHIGASLKDLGKKWFAFSKMDITTVNMIAKLKEGGMYE